MSQVFTTTHLLKRLPFAYYDYSVDYHKAYRKLFSLITDDYIQLRVPPYSINELKPLLHDDAVNEHERSFIKLLLDYITSSKIRAMTSKEFDVIDHKLLRVQRSIAEKIQFANSEHVAFALHDIDNDHNQIDRIVNAIQKLLIHDDEFGKSKYDFLLGEYKLPSIGPDEKKWEDVLQTIKVPTNKIRIFDNYFVSNNHNLSLRPLFSSLLYASKSFDTEIEIISDIYDTDQLFQLEQIQNKYEAWLTEQEEDLDVNISVYTLKMGQKKFRAYYHDRFMQTDHWRVEVGAGFDLNYRNNSNPKLISRYGIGQELWQKYHQLWPKFLEADCDRVY